MTSILKALYAFWSSFGIPAYHEYSVPDDASLPYITYSASGPSWEGSTLATARIWYRATGYAQIAAMIDRISRDIGEGKSIPTDTGAIYISKEETFCQFMEDEDASIKSAYLAMQMHAPTH